MPRHPPFRAAAAALAAADFETLDPIGFILPHVGKSYFIPDYTHHHSTDFFNSVKWLPKIQIIDFVLTKINAL